MEYFFVPVYGYEDQYYVSSTGIVKSIARVDSLGKFRKERILKPGITQDGYLRVCFFKNGKATHPLIHRVVFESFKHPIPADKEINHLNGVRDDNFLTNLECVTHSENIEHSVNVLKSNYATYGNARMTEETVRHIFLLKESRLTNKKIAEIVKFSESSIENVLHRRTWPSINIYPG